MVLVVRASFLGNYSVLEGHHGGIHTSVSYDAGVFSLDASIVYPLPIHVLCLETL